MTWGAAMLGSLASTLERPAWWLLGLGSFLVRGGLLVFLLPIVILPTPAGLQNAFGAELVGFVFGSPSVSFITAVIVATAALTTWLILGGLVAAWTDIALVAAVAGSRPISRVVRGWSGLAWRALGIRLASHLPLAVVLSWGLARVYEAIYAEYLHPGDPAIPLALRIVERVPEVVAVIGLAWIAGEAAGGVGIRHLALGGLSAGQALVRGWLDVLLRPAVMATVLITGAVMVAIAVPLAGAAGGAWDRLRAVLADGADPVILLLALGAFVATWLAGIVVVALVAAWRSAAWTFEVARRIPSAQRHAVSAGSV
jgi:hypothetical protein